MSQDKVVRQRIATRAIIVNDEGKLLVLREASNYEDGKNAGRYDLPGGRVDIGESPFDALSREVLEETGLEIVAEKRPVSVEEWFPVIDGGKNQIIGIFFVCRPITTNVVLSDDHDSFEWINPAECYKYSLLEPLQDVIREYLQL